MVITTAATTMAPYNRKPVKVASSQSSCTFSISRSCGACRTMIVEPTMHKTQPIIPKMCSLSPKIICASIALIIILCAPRGVTSIAGAKA
nr:Os05g0513450 [Ipomoea batatas]